jgi:hypothetical protein
MNTTLTLPSTAKPTTSTPTETTTTTTQTTTAATSKRDRWCGNVKHTSTCKQTTNKTTSSKSIDSFVLSNPSKTIVSPSAGATYFY